MTNGNDPAYPMIDTNFRDGIPVLELRYEGLTKREYFAAMALQGNVSAIGDASLNENAIKVLVSESVKLADAIMAELNKQ